MGITDSEILRAEKFGSREYPLGFLGRCVLCQSVVMNDEAEACRDGYGNLFCSGSCFSEFHGKERQAF